MNDAYNLPHLPAQFQLAHLRPLTLEVMNDLHFGFLFLFFLIQIKMNVTVKYLTQGAIIFSYYIYSVFIFYNNHL